VYKNLRSHPITMLLDCSMKISVIITVLLDCSTKISEKNVQVAS
jgi:hypothetical protein